MRSAIWRRILILLSLAATACAPRADWDPFLVIAGPKGVMQVEVTDEEGSPLWSLEAKSPQDLEAILYAVVPDGFTQLEPTDGWPPRPLEPGELVIARTRTTKRLFTHIGVAKSATTMEILNYKMELLESR